MSIIIIVLAVIVGFFVSSAILLGISRLFGISGVTYKSSVIVMLLITIVSVVLDLLLSLVVAGILMNIIVLVISYLVFHYLYKRYYQASWGKTLGVYVVNIIVGTIIGIVIAIPVRLLVVEPIVVNGSSMSPHYNQGDYLFIDKFDKNYMRDDVIVFTRPDSGTYLIKRIVGLPGEKIGLSGGTLTVNGKALNDAFIAGPISGNADVTLGADEYFVLGDNSSSSAVDSRTVGPIKASQIVGKARKQ